MMDGAGVRARKSLGTARSALFLAHVVPVMLENFLTIYADAIHFDFGYCPPSLFKGAFC